MNPSDLKLELPWQAVKEKLKENDHRLTDEDLVYAPGQEKELFERLAKKMNRTGAEIKALIESVSANAGKAS